MNIIKTNSLNSDELLAVKELEALCKEYDNLTGSLFLSGELNLYDSLPCFFLLYEGNELCAFLSIFVPSEDEALISVCTHPDKRRRGFATNLLCEAADLLWEYDIHDMTFLSEPTAIAFISLIKKLNGRLTGSEYFMVYDNPVPAGSNEDNPASYRLIPAIPENLSTISVIHSHAFETECADSEAFIKELFYDGNVKSYVFQETGTNKIIGSCFLSISHTRLIILGVCIDPAMQGQGLGRRMITELLTQCMTDFNGIPVSLQVSGHSLAAKHLYESLGFKITSQFDYYTADCE